MSALTALRRQFTAHRLAQLAIGVEWLATARTLGELYRLHGEQARLTLETALLWVNGAMIALAFLALSSLLYFARRDRLAGLAGVAMIVALVAYKALVLGLD